MTIKEIGTLNDKTTRLVIDCTMCGSETIYGDQYSLVGPLLKAKKHDRTHKEKGERVIITITGSI